MKKGKYIVMALAAAAAIGIGGCKVSTSDTTSGGGGGGGGGTGTVVAAAFPTAKDAFEGDAGDNTRANASAIAVGGALQTRSIYPQGDIDWVKVSLTSGKTYEIFTTNLNYVADTELELFYSSNTGSTPNKTGDDYLSFDDNIRLTAPYTGDYYIRVSSFDIYDMASYQLGVRIFVDNDHDGYSTTYDCNDSNPNVYPYAPEIPGNGIDEDCSGADAPSGTDSYEPDDDSGNAKSLYQTAGAVGEIIYRSGLYATTHTINPSGDVDYHSFSVPAHSGAYIVDESHGPKPISESLRNASDVPLNSDNNDNNGSIFLSVVNDTSSSETFFVQSTALDGASLTWYATALVHYGTDNDGDGFYTKDWYADCDDTNDLIYPGSPVPADNHTDWNCNGSLSN